jgi:Protein of unknown function (DUF1592)/Protein of unknown function (DUF1588)/Protein of unknown function (DUF1595)/Protein of unknown function (DUF1585)
MLALRQVGYPKIQTFFGCAPDGTVTSPVCMKSFTTQFVKRAYRREPTAEEVTDLVTLGATIATRDNSFSGGIRTIVEAVLQSPSFLYLPDLTLPTSQHPAFKQIDDYSMATRLSYLLTNNPPSDALLAKAAAGQLRTQQAVLAEAQTLLASAEAKTTAHEFFIEWLGLRDVPTLTKAPELTKFNAEVARSMLTETLMMFDDHAFTPGKDFFDILDSDTTFVNGPLANIYGVTVPSAAAFSRVSLPSNRRGLLGTGSWLASRATIDTSHPIRRGAGVMKRLMCSEISLPANTPEEKPDLGPGNHTQREIQGAQTSSATCQGCHSAINPIGFGFESFDAIGQFRATEFGRPVDDTGVLLVNGQPVSFKGEPQLATLLKSFPEVERCFVQQWTRWAKGRKLEIKDKDTVSSLTRDMRADGKQFQALVKAYVQSDAFRFVEP